MGQGGAFDSIRNSGEALKEVWTDLPVGTLLDIGEYFKKIKQNQCQS